MMRCLRLVLPLPPRGSNASGPDSAVGEAHVIDGEPRTGQDGVHGVDHVL